MLGICGTKRSSRTLPACFCLGAYCAVRGMGSGLAGDGGAAPAILARRRLRQHRPTAARRTTATGEPPLRAPAQPARVLEAIVIAHLLAGADCALSADKDAVVVIFDRFTVRIAAVVNP